MKHKKPIQKSQKDFGEAEKHSIIQELIETQSTKAEIWRKYTGQEEEHGQLLRWMKKLGYNTGIKTRRPNIVTQLRAMPKKQKQPIPLSGKRHSVPESDFETLQLKKRIKDLEAQLQDAEMKAIAFSTMVDIAEKEFKIPIRKKFNTKP